MYGLRKCRTWEFWQQSNWWAGWLVQEFLGEHAQLFQMGATLVLSLLQVNAVRTSDGKKHVHVCSFKFIINGTHLPDLALAERL